MALLVYALCMSCKHGNSTVSCSNCNRTPDVARQLTGCAVELGDCTRLLKARQTAATIHTRLYTHDRLHSCTAAAPANNSCCERLLSDHGQSQISQVKACWAVATQHLPHTVTGCTEHASCVKRSEAGRFAPFVNAYCNAIIATAHLSMTQRTQQHFTTACCPHTLYRWLSPCSCNGCLIPSAAAAAAAEGCRMVDSSSSATAQYRWLPHTQ
jgi:hypothetical protein